MRNVGVHDLPRRVRRLTPPAALTASLLALAAPAGAQSFRPATPVAGLGAQPALAQVTGAALARDGGSVIAGTADDAGRRRAFAAFGDAAAPPATARGFGPPAGAFDLAMAANASGDVALTYTVGHVAYLTTCRAGRCRPTTRVGTSPIKPQSAVAVQPSSGRAIVMWRGRTRSGANRLLWRITTNGRLGRIHTLGEFGDAPRLGTDASGRTVAVWLADGRAGRRGVRSAARRAGAFRPPSTVTRSPAGALRLVSSAGGDSVAAWLSAQDGIDPQGPLGTVQVATRTASTAFGAPQSLGTGSTLALAGSPDGHALLATSRHVGTTSVVVAAARRLPGAAFGALGDIAPAQFVSDAFGPAAAGADGGRALVTWASGNDPSAPGPSGVYEAIAAVSGAFSAPQLLADARTATLPQPTAAAISPDRALVAWTGPQGGQVAQADLP
jgi:hypothetical protein